MDRTKSRLPELIERQEEMHELARHIIQAREALKVTADTFMIMDDHFKDSTDKIMFPSYVEAKRRRNSGMGPFKIFRTYSSMLMNLEKRAESFDRRLQEEIQMVSSFRLLRYLR